MTRLSQIHFELCTATAIYRFLKSGHYFWNTLYNINISAARYNAAARKLFTDKNPSMSLSLSCRFWKQKNLCRKRISLKTKESINKKVMWPSITSSSEVTEIYLKRLGLGSSSQSLCQTELFGHDHDILSTLIMLCLSISNNYYTWHANPEDSVTKIRFWGPHPINFGVLILVFVNMLETPL